MREVETELDLAQSRPNFQGTDIDNVDSKNNNLSPSLFFPESRKDVDAASFDDYDISTRFQHITRGLDDGDRKLVNYAEFMSNDNPQND